MGFVAVQLPWFFGYGIALELVFALIVLAVAIFALRLYKVTSERSIRLLGTGFLLVSISYFFQSFFNFLLLSKIGEKPFLTINDFSLAFTLEVIGAYGYVFFMLIGLIVLLYMTFEIKKKSIFFVMLLIVLFPILLAENTFFLFYYFSTICFAFVSWHFIKNYFEKKKSLSLMIAISFVFLALSGIPFLLSLSHGAWYVVAHLLGFVAYVLILINFYMVLKK